METILITGGTGLIGKALTRLLIQHNYHVTILTRDPKKATASGAFGNQVTYAAWDVKAQTIDVEAIKRANAIIHLAGAGVVDKRWTDAYKKEIIDSRIESSKLLVKALSETQHHVKTFISSSAIGWYGADNAQSLQSGFTEEVPADDSFLGQTCKLWEASVKPVKALDIRLVTIRTGIVLAKEGGAFAEFKKPVTMGVAAVLGNGDQKVSWIHIDDLCGIYLYAFENKSMTGSYNAVAPAPVTNQVLTDNIAKTLKGKFYITIHVPRFVLKLVLGESSIEVLKSATVSSKKIEMAGYTFKWPAIHDAVSNLLS